ncbi:MAG: tRNA (guanine6-N2)-methyltransferase [Thermoplasmata archaeon]|nr:tRNA (guanine6-N2)-methyltransferase [Thermoplasmata archaeon]
MGRALVEGDADLLYALNLAHPTATRVHLVLAEGEVHAPEDVARLAREVDWTRVFAPDLSFAVECLRVGEHAWTSQDVKRAAGAAIQQATGARVRLNRPDVEVHVEVRGAHAFVAVNASGASLHERPWRVYQHPATLNACIASALVAWSGWLEQGGLLLDPTCGSGTIPIEADFRARRRAVNLARQDWAFARLRLHDEERYQSARDALACEALDEGPPIVGHERNARHLNGARQNGARAAARIAWREGDVADLARPEGLSTVVANPPWGLRVESRQGSDRVGAMLRAKLAEWRPATAVLLVGDRRFEQYDPRPVEARGLAYGSTYCRALTYSLG